MIKNRILIVTGMHRSGTSVITEWLHRCGLHVGEELMGAETCSDEGYFEDVDFLHAHQSILKGRRVTYEGYTDPIRLLSHDEQDMLNDIIYYKNGFNQQWGWKDPRTCLFLDTYRQLIPEAFYFVVLRDYRSVINSLILRMYNQAEEKHAAQSGFSKFIWEHVQRKNSLKNLFKKHSQRYLKVWIAYYEAIITHLQQLSPGNYLVADYINIHENDKAAFEHITQQWGFSLNFFNLRNIFRKRHLQEIVDVDQFIKDKSLSARASAIESSLRQLSIFNAGSGTMLAI